MRPHVNAGCALVPVVANLQWSPLPQRRRRWAEPSFVTQLIATAEWTPQTGASRRATSAAYGSTAKRNQITVAGTLIRRIA